MLRCSAVIAIVMTAVVHGQSDSPAVAGAWTLSVVETGGFAGGSSTVTVTSTGQVTCSPIACATPLAAARLQRIAAAWAAVASEDWGPQNRGSIFGTGGTSTCHDCGRTTVTLKRREAERIRTDEATWDGLQKVAPTLRTLTDLVLELKPEPTR